MKTKNGDNFVISVILTVVAIIIVGILMLWQTGYFDQNKKILDRSTGKIDDAFESMAEFDLLVYDGKKIKGEKLVDLMEDLRDKKVVVSIGVRTLAAISASPTGVPVYYNYGFGTDITPSPALTITPPPSKDKQDYINPNASFLGKVVKNKNNEIVLIEFTQQP